MIDIEKLETEGKRRLVEIQRQIAALKNPHLHWDLQGMDNLERLAAISTLEEEFKSLMESG